MLTFKTASRGKKGAEINLRATTLCEKGGVNKDIQEGGCNDKKKDTERRKTKEGGNSSGGFQSGMKTPCDTGGKKGIILETREQPWWN